MTDILIESVAALIAGIIFLILTYNMGIKRAHELPGSRFIVSAQLSSVLRYLKV